MILCSVEGDLPDPASAGAEALVAGQKIGNVIACRIFDSRDDVRSAHYGDDHYHKIADGDNGAAVGDVPECLLIDVALLAHNKERYDIREYEADHAEPCKTRLAGKERVEHEQ